MTPKYLCLRLFFWALGLDVLGLSWYPKWSLSFPRYLLLLKNSHLIPISVNEITSHLFMSPPWESFFLYPTSPRPSNTIPTYIPERTEKKYSDKSLYTIARSVTIHNIQKVETTEMSINKWMDKQNTLYPYYELFFRHKKEWNTDTHYDTEEPCKHHAEWKKPDANGHLWLGFHLCEMSTIGKSTETKSRLVELGERGVNA